MYVTYCKLCHLSSIITENVLHVCKLLQVMSFSHNSVNFLWLNLTKWTPLDCILVILLSCGVHLFRFNHKNRHVGSILSDLTKKITKLGLKDITGKGLQTSSTFSVIIEDKEHNLQ
ncbi:hypothetical protein Hanom_Chr04g00381881 [Helianthus anomalus]